MRMNENLAAIHAYFELSINKKDEVKKLIKHKLISVKQLKKIRKDILEV